ncbi:uncharacterized protein LOC119309255 [Triticum dicoccoides]|uniref:uncharacterized protein LOC119309255 n=1 Tax=Triticum dicoccoides TaxID=85692 RepID=UPI001890E18F|nr:uncharacterized protein LOC119309255 [Triticum dicoccoides]
MHRFSKALSHPSTLGVAVPASPSCRRRRIPPPAPGSRRQPRLHWLWDPATIPRVAGLRDPADNPLAARHLDPAANPLAAGHLDLAANPCAAGLRNPATLGVAGRRCGQTPPPDANLPPTPSGLYAGAKVVLHTAGCAQHKLPRFAPLLSSDCAAPTTGRHPAPSVTCKPPTLSSGDVHAVVACRESCRNSLLLLHNGSVMGILTVCLCPRRMQRQPDLL